MIRIREAYNKASEHLFNGLMHLQPDILQSLRLKFYTAFKRGYNTAMNDLLRKSRSAN